MIYHKLNYCSGYLKSLVYNENFHDYTALRTGDKDEATDAGDDSDSASASSSSKGEGQAVEEVSPRLTYSLQKFHDVRIDRHAPHWRKIFLRGLGMRRYNIIFYDRTKADSQLGKLEIELALK